MARHAGKPVSGGWDRFRVAADDYESAISLSAAGYVEGSTWNVYCVAETCGAKDGELFLFLTSF